ncbi:MAG: hypothetical protein FWB91_08530 [Defluviitaleaceae bacterium]|nr:hypothetical protein [Defluviitaleaceae bacterium]
MSSKTFTVCFIRLHGTAEYHGLGPGEWNIVPFIGEYDNPDEGVERCRDCKSAVNP